MNILLQWQRVEGLGRQLSTVSSSPSPNLHPHQHTPTLNQWQRQRPHWTTPHAQWTTPFWIEGQRKNMLESKNIYFSFQATEMFLTSNWGRFCQKSKSIMCNIWTVAGRWKMQKRCSYRVVEGLLNSFWCYWTVWCYRTVSGKCNYFR